MIEQMNLFGERDVLLDVCDYLVRRYDRMRKDLMDDERDMRFDEWLIGNFRTWSGSTVHDLEGYSFIQFTPAGITLSSKTGKREQIPKEKILQQFGLAEVRKR